MILTIILTVAVVCFVGYFPTYTTYGKVVGDNELLDLIEDEKNKIEYNRFDDDIFTVGNLVVVKMMFIPIFSKYHIQNANVRVSRFSKSHKILNNIQSRRPSRLSYLK